MSSRTLLYTANADSIDTFFGTDAAKLLQAIYNADDRLTGRSQIRNGDPELELDVLFIIVDENGNKDHDLTTDIANELLARVAAEKVRVE